MARADRQGGIHTKHQTVRTHKLSNIGSVETIVTLKIAQAPGERNVVWGGSKQINKKKAFRVKMNHNK